MVKYVVFNDGEDSTVCVASVAYEWIESSGRMTLRRQSNVTSWSNGRCAVRSSRGLFWLFPQCQYTQSEECDSIIDRDVNYWEIANIFCYRLKYFYILSEISILWVKTGFAHFAVCFVLFVFTCFAMCFVPLYLHISPCVLCFCIHMFCYVFAHLCLCFVSLYPQISLCVLWLVLTHLCLCFVPLYLRFAMCFVPLNLRFYFVFLCSYYVEGRKKPLLDWTPLSQRDPFVKQNSPGNPS
jgi:hypothetical protein